MRSPVVLLLGGHPGGELGAVERGMQALERRLEADLQRARVQVQGWPKQLLQRGLRNCSVNAQVTRRQLAKSGNM